MSRYKNLVLGKIRNFVREGGFETEFTLTEGNQSLELKGVYTRKNITFDAYNDNFFQNSTIAHITFNELDLIESNYPYKVNNRTSLIKHRVSLTDDLGIARSYTIEDVKPSETFGLITIYLSNHA